MMRLQVSDNKDPRISPKLMHVPRGCRFRVMTRGLQRVELGVIRETWLVAMQH